MEPIKITIAPTSIEAEKFIKGSNIYLVLYENCLTMDHKGEYDVEEEGDRVLMSADSRSTINKGAISGVYRTFDPYNNIYVIDISGVAKFNIKNRKRADMIYSHIVKWKFGI